VQVTSPDGGLYEGRISTTEVEYDMANRSRRLIVTMVMGELKDPPPLPKRMEFKRPLHEAPEEPARPTETYTANPKYGAF
jgi:hypothetical protein